ncbi:hypothetical protein BD289DRAFT_9543 [Coniella lustricola]|uniref:Uncharacterized protein n=1 Tax=Coniella lustricola TaxID=2025994 RepID=A0A2T3A4G9_9PEZI|nr:hypothetical protein BD289DRAFT_9543 [Coniella lustricola]
MCPAELKRVKAMQLSYVSERWWWWMNDLVEIPGLCKPGFEGVVVVKVQIKIKISSTTQSDNIRLSPGEQALKSNKSVQKIAHTSPTHIHKYTPTQSFGRLGLALHQHPERHELALPKNPVGGVSSEQDHHPKQNTHESLEQSAKQPIKCELLALRYGG